MTRHAANFHSRAQAEGFELATEVKLSWLTRNGHAQACVQDTLPGWAIETLDRILAALDGDAKLLADKTRGSMRADFLLNPGEIEVEYDEIQHFTGARLITLELYPENAVLGFDPKEYASIVRSWQAKGDRGFAHKSAAEFPGPNGRARQRAYFDAFRDLAAPFFGNGPLLRIAAPDNDYSTAVQRLAGMLSQLEVKGVS
jgi:hypothetical protein